MVLSAISVIYISTPESRDAYEASFSNSFFMVYDTSDDENNTDSNSAKLGKSSANALVIVCVICAATFLIVLLYKYRCMKILWGYMILANTMLLGFVSFLMFEVAIDRYQLYGVDKISFYLFLINISVVGTLSIFGSTKIGIPSYMTQMYLIYSSVLTAWLLSNYDSWTAWLLLIMLALYDLFAVLTPCGPLKALVNLMQQDNAPEMPGLLYEANVYNPNSNNNNNNNSRESNNNRNIGNNQVYNTLQPIQTNQQPERVSGTNQLEGVGGESMQSKSPIHENVTDRISTVYESNISPNGNPLNHEEVNNSKSLLHSNTNEEEQDLLLLMTESESKESDADANSFEEASSISSSSGPYHSRRIAENQYVASIERTPRENRVEIILNNPYLSTRIKDSKNDDEEDEEAIVMMESRQSPQNIHGQSEISNSMSPPTAQRRTGSVPYAIAKLYRLPTVNDPQPPWIIAQRRTDQTQRLVLRPAQVISEQFNDEDSVVSTSYANPNGPGSSHVEEENVNSNMDDTASISTVMFTIDQLTCLIDVIFPVNGGYIEKATIQNANDGETRYLVIDRAGSLKRILFVKSDNGKIYEDLRYGPNGVTISDEERRDRKKERNTIRLGLGDFIFYSVLVSKAALYSYTTFVSCTMAIVTGLGLTLLILAALGKALPALPISIALGVLFYLQTRYVTQPWIDQINFLSQQQTMYV
jgi:presenilin-like A22 family membrane protease